MDAHIDWLSWTEKENLEPRSPAQLYEIAKYKAKERFGDAHKIMFNGQGIDTAISRPPYRLSVARDDNGFQVYGGSHTNTILYELRGRGCEAIRNQEWQYDFAACLADRCTRFDLAVDIHTQTRPSDFANERDHARFRSVSFIRSATGETVYVGSPKSDRFCRIYRYNPPHPRADLLRVEFVTRRKLAATAALQFADTPEIKHLVAQLGNSYGFAHADWQPGVKTDERLRAPVIERKHADTMSWLYKQVAPALRRLIVESEFDMTDFIEYVYEGLDLPGDVDS